MVDHVTVGAHFEFNMNIYDIVRTRGMSPAAPPERERDIVDIALLDTLRTFPCIIQKPKVNANSL